MVSVVQSSIAGVLCGVLVLVLVLVPVPPAGAEQCSEFRDESNRRHERQNCAFFCCGDCWDRFCCLDSRQRLSKEQQQSCSLRPSSGSARSVGAVLGSVFGAVLPVITCVALVICCVAPCCCLYKKCRKGSNPAVMTTTTVVHRPPQGPGPSDYQPSYPGYRPVPVQPGFGGFPMPTAPPPPYMEATGPGFPSAAFAQAPPTFPLQPLNGMYAPPPPPPPSEEQAPPAYNPSYAAKH